MPNFVGVNNVRYSTDYGEPNQLNFSKDAPRLKMSISSPQYVKDMTNEFQQSKATVAKQ